MTVATPSGFWGLVVEPGKNYSQEVPNTFKLTMASLGPQAEGKTSRTTLILKIDDKEDYALCSLTLGKVEQQPLDLVFAQGESISFQVEGDSSIHLTGYYLEDSVDDFIDDDMEEDGDEIYSDEAEEDSQIEYDSEFDSEEYDSECSDEECTENHRNPRIQLVDSEEEEDVSEEDLSEEDGEEEEDSEEDEEEESEMSTDEDAESAKRNRTVHFDLPEAKKAKEEPKAAAQPQKPAQPQQPAKAAPQQANKIEEPQKAGPVKKTLPSGLQIEDLKLGNGVKAAKGKSVLIHYKGTLTNGKIFDSSFGKKPLKFTVGRGDVIKGMDIGIVGMCVGGSRKLVIPAPLAYGNQALPGIPKNSTLIFEIRLEKIF